MEKDIKVNGVSFNTGYARSIDKNKFIDVHKGLFHDREPGERLVLLEKIFNQINGIKDGNNISGSGALQKDRRKKNS